MRIFLHREQKSPHQFSDTHPSNLIVTMFTHFKQPFSIQKENNLFYHITGRGISYVQYRIYSIFIITQRIALQIHRIIHSTTDSGQKYLSTTKTCIH